MKNKDNDNFLEGFELLDLFNPLNFDRKFYNFDRIEKDMHPYDLTHDSKGQRVIITHNVLGINKEDLKLSKKIEDGITYLVIKGKSQDEITGKNYSINSRMSIDEKTLDLSKAKSTLKNGLLYIEIPYKEQKKLADGESFIDIL